MSHALLVLWLDLALARPRVQSRPDLQVLLTAERPAEPVRPAPDESQGRRFIDIAGETPDETPPATPTENIGLRHLRARDPEGRAEQDDKPRTKGNTEAPIIRPGSPGTTPIPPPRPITAQVRGGGLPLKDDLPETTHEPPPQSTKGAPDPVKPVPPPDRGTPNPTQPTQPSRRGSADPAEADSEPPNPAVATPSEVTPPRPTKPDKPRPPRRPVDEKAYMVRAPGSPYVLHLAGGVRATVQRNPDAGARARGHIQFNVKRHKYAPYYKHMLDRIRAALLVRRRLAYRQHLNLAEPRMIRVGFQVSRDGKFHGLAVMDDGGLVLVASDIMDGIGSASPLDAFPDFIEEDKLHILFNCHVE